MPMRYAIDMRSVLAAFGVSALVAATGAAASGDLDAVLGRALFERDWVPAPASTDAADGLGPLFAARSCAGCHSGPALSARFVDAPEGRIAGRGFVIRFGDAEGRADPLYGHMLQSQAVQGLRPEGRVVLTATDDPAKGYAYALDLERGPLDPATRVSARLATPLLGRAALEAVDGDAVLGHADPDDRDGDGISGRARIVDGVLGRFGWKAQSPTIEAQVADAFAMDIGLANDMRPFPHGDCTALEPDCLAAPTGASALYEGQELAPEIVGLVAAYVRSLPAPLPPDDLAGAELFVATGCAGCHVPALPAWDGGMVPLYSDLLLHDMGAGLDDGVGEPGVASSEWRTAPLIAMAPSKGRRYLHDGRAATVDAAIRAHGGEAAAAQSRYEALGEADRRALVRFLEAL
jgi:CxxC motif-containing protein (DUF1111 family)